MAVAAAATAQNCHWRQNHINKGNSVTASCNGSQTAFFGKQVGSSYTPGLWIGGKLAHNQCCRSVVSMSLLIEVPKESTLKRVESSKADPRTVVSVILGGGAGRRLFPLTKRRAKPAVPIGGAYRLIDVPMSNCINSGINKVYILTQFNSASLNRHLARAYSFCNGVNFGDGFVEVLAATQRPGEMGKNWFQGTADAVRQFAWLFEDAKNKEIDDILILSGDHLYRMDYMDFVQKHRDSGADITISCIPIDDSRASDFDLMKIDDNGQVLYFSEKPKGDDLKAMGVDTTVLGLSPEDAKKKPYIASMGVYVFKKEILLNLLRWRFPTANDFGSEIIPASAKEYLVKAYLFDDYWEDIGTIKSFFEANLALTAQPPKFSFYDAKKPIYTSPRNVPPTKVDNCKIVDSIVSHGCFLQNCSIEHSIIGIRSRIGSDVSLQDAVMLGADYYETDVEVASLLAEGKVPVGIGQNTKIRNCIIDKNARIGKNVTIANSEGQIHRRASLLGDSHYLVCSTFSEIWHCLESKLCSLYEDYAENMCSLMKLVHSNHFVLSGGKMYVYSC